VGVLWRGGEWPLVALAKTSLDNAEAPAGETDDLRAALRHERRTAIGPMQVELDDLLADERLGAEPECD
jgi:hypothetical protein